MQHLTAAIIEFALTFHFQAEVAEKRYEDIVSGNVEPVTWEDIKKEVKG